MINMSPLKREPLLDQDRQLKLPDTTELSDQHTQTPYILIWIRPQLCQWFIFNLLNYLSTSDLYEHSFKQLTEWWVDQ